MIQEALNSNTKFEQFVPKGAETHKELRERWILFIEGLFKEIATLNRKTCDSIYCNVKSKDTSSDYESDLSNSQFDEDSSLEDTGYIDQFEILIFTHGAYMREAMKYFLNEFNCEFPFDTNELNKSPPNTSISKFRVELDVNSSGEDLKNCLRFVKCEYLYEKNHLESETESQNLCDL